MRWVSPTRGDLALAGVVTSFGVLSVAATAPAKGPSGLALGLGVLVTAPLALRRAAPFVVLLAIGTGMVLEAAKHYPLAAGSLGGLFATASAAYLTDRRGAILAAGTFAAATVTLTALALAPAGERGEYVALVSAFVVAVLPALVGDVLRTLRERNRELEVLREVAAREAVAQDRVRIARDVHDVVGHALAGIALQARAGRRLLDRDGPRTAEALRQIDEIATRALGDTREAIGQIRVREPDAGLHAAPRLDDLSQLVDHLQQDDLRVQLRHEDDTSHLPPLIQASAYRIVQEALSNVIKHARPATAVVTVAMTGTTLELEVRDDGRHPPKFDPGGQGLRGMRERAAQCGGSVQAGPVETGGWRVSAHLPIARSPA